MRKRGLRIGLICAAVALTVAGVAYGAGQSEEVEVGWEGFTTGGATSPKRLSKKVPTPVALTFEARWNGNSPPPQLSELDFELDRFITFDTEGLATCHRPTVEGYPGREPITVACRDAVVGGGSTTVQLAFPEEALQLVDGKTTIFNAGTRGGVTSLLAYTLFSAPIGEAIVSEFKVKPIDNGRYGLLARATLPKIAGGAGSVTSFRLKLERRFGFDGERRSFVNARCVDGKLQGNIRLGFADGTAAVSEFVRPCFGLQ